MSKARKPKIQPKGDYLVGYARPPEETKFRPGVCGNRLGRRKGSENVRTVVRRVFLDRKVSLNERGSKRKVSVLEGMLLRVAERGLNKGDPRALTVSLSVMQRAGFLTEVEAEALQESLSSEDQKMLDDFLERKGVRLTGKKNADAPSPRPSRKRSR